MPPPLARSLASQLSPLSGTSGTSRLTATGDPLEIAIVRPGNEVRLTVDPVPNSGPETRLRICRDRVALPRKARTIEAELAGLRPAPGLRYGAWLGLRCGKRGVQSKLYLEAPADNRWAALEAWWAGHPPILTRRGARPVMAGLDPHREGVEFYQSLDGLCRRSLALILDRAGMPDRAGAVIDLLSVLRDRTLRHELLFDECGFSIAWTAPGAACAVTLYFIADALLGPPERAASAIRTAGRLNGWDMSLYDRLASPPRPYHTLIGITVAPGRPAALSVHLAAAGGGS